MILYIYDIWVTRKQQQAFRALLQSARLQRSCVKRISEQLELTRIEKKILELEKKIIF